MNEETTYCGTIAVIGAPNAGKSTLVNALVGQKVTIVSPKAQTTRTKIMGIALHDKTQMILIDTPGIFDPHRRLDRAMVAAAKDGSTDADIIAIIIDGRAGAGPKVERVLDMLEHRKEPKWLILNKVDIARKDKLLSLTDKLVNAQNFDQIFYISAETGDGLEELKQAFAKEMPISPWHFPEEQVSDVTDRLLAAEITREQLYRQLHQELPYACTVETEKYSERDDGSIEIHQQILVGRPTQKAIILGKGGSQIKSIGETARKELKQLMQVPVHLYLHVKVKADWDEDRSLYTEIGLDWVE